MSAELEAGLATLAAGITRLRASHDALLAAAKGAVDLLDHTVGYVYEFNERLAALKAAIANAERSAP